MQTLEPRTRKQIEADIKAKRELIVKTNEEIRELLKESCLLSDEEQWFTEEMETFTKRVNRKKVTEEKLVGRIHWNQNFKDEDTGSVITIKRSQAVRVNGEWI